MLEPGGQGCLWLLRLKFAELSSSLVCSSVSNVQYMSHLTEGNKDLPVHLGVRLKEAICCVVLVKAEEDLEEVYGKLVQIF